MDIMSALTVCMTIGYAKLIFPKTYAITIIFCRFAFMIRGMPSYPKNHYPWSKRKQYRTSHIDTSRK